MAPHAGGAKVVFNKTSAINGILGVFAGQLLAHLCRDKRRVLYSADLGIEYSSFKQLHCDKLTHLRFDWDSNHMAFVRLAQVQSGTLFSLTACSLQVHDLDTLILGSNAEPVIFRNISYLRLVFSKTDGDFSTRTPIDRATAIFPNLQTILIDGEYTLCNDMLFRGDRSALRQLRLTINPRTLDTLCASGALVRQKYSSLRCVALGATGFHSGTSTQSDKLLQLLTNMSACARILDISRMVRHDEASIAPSKLVRGISFGKLGHNLQVLDMGTCELGYFEMLSVIGAMSHLTDLHCKPLDFESTFSFMPESKVYQFMSETFGPLNTNFRFWRVGAVGTISMKSLAKMAIMTAIICPNFMFASVAPKNKDEYERHISKALGAPETNEYIERIRPLLCDHYGSSNHCLATRFMEKKTTIF
ncbi:hypothetical protein GGF37_001263 [Kickxella alabastrina]|nr:hypothetical protein GGF37_001263 [Kickxella alabastrina]